jgi:Na+/phosphate symporter
MATISNQKQDILEPIIDNLRNMVGSARSAFNRHSRGALEELKKLKEEVDRAIKEATSQAQAALLGKSEAGKAALLKFISILSHLDIMSENIASLAEPIQKKIQEGVLFTDKAVTQTNYLFNHQTGMLRSLLDIIKTDNEFLKKYLLEEGRILIQLCLDVATEHETRMIEGLCMPQASPIFLAMLDRMRLIWRHVLAIVKLLSQES